MHDAQDLTQSFFAHLIEREIYGRADRAKGRFRSFLLAALKNFLADAYAYATCAETWRGQRISCLSMRAGPKRPSRFSRRIPQAVSRCAKIVFLSGVGPSAVVAASLEQLAAEYQSEGKEKLFED